MSDAPPLDQPGLDLAQSETPIPSRPTEERDVDRVIASPLQSDPLERGSA